MLTSCGNAGPQAAGSLYNHRMRLNVAPDGCFKHDGYEVVRLSANGFADVRGRSSMDQELKGMRDWMRIYAQENTHAVSDQVVRIAPSARRKAPIDVGPDKRHFARLPTAMTNTWDYLTAAGLIGGALQELDASVSFGDLSQDHAYFGPHVLITMPGSFEQRMHVDTECSGPGGEVNSCVQVILAVTARKLRVAYSTEGEAPFRTGYIHLKPGDAVVLAMDKSFHAGCASFKIKMHSIASIQTYAMRESSVLTSLDNLRAAEGHSAFDHLPHGKAQLYAMR